MSSWFWRDTARNPEFFGIDATAVYPFLLFFLHMRWWTFMLALTAAVSLGILARFGFTLPVFFRLARGYFAGPARFAVPWTTWLKRQRR